MMSFAEMFAGIQHVYVVVQGYIPQDAIYLVSYALFKLFLGAMAVISTVYLILTVYSICTRSRGREKSISDEEAPLVTVQIPTYNERVALRCADRCLEFDYPKDRYEIIVGDDSSDRQVSDEIDAFARAHNIVVTRRGSNQGFKSGNLNHMLQHSKGEVIVVFDSDFVPEKDFLRRIVTPFMHDASLSGVQARWKFLDKNTNSISLLGSTIVTVFHRICIPFINNRSKVAFLCGS